MEGIVIGVDESDAAAIALRWGVDHADQHHRPVTALMAWSNRDQPQFEPDAPFDPHYGGPDARRDVQRIVARAFGSVPPGVSGRSQCGDPATELIEASRSADLVVVGARGMGGFRGLLLGSVSREVLNAATCPVAVVRCPPVDPAGPIVVGIDGSPISRVALRWALDEGRTRGRRVVALTTWHLAYTGDGYVHGYVDAESLQASAEMMLDRQLDQVDTSGLPEAVERRVESASPAAALVDASHTASMVVVGSRGHRPAAGLLLGSVSDQVTHHASGPVVVVPPSACEGRAH
jgi:nucleotide-binding universal stress UspA family protein